MGAECVHDCSVAHLAAEVMTCGFGAGQPGIQKAAEWVRTAFHDAATHDAEIGKGGLDASIQYELDRKENLGAALNNTMADIAGSVDSRNSAADLLATSLIIAVARCGNLRVPLRIGRKDASEAGIMGVPEAHSDLSTTKQRFATAGFNEGILCLKEPCKTRRLIASADMITLVACGHSIGGVHSVDHPEIVPGKVSAENKLSFDSTKDILDNNVVTEYLDNSTLNPLIRNVNDTLNSDKRVFAADDNATMNMLADPIYFKAQCETLFGRMLDTVPNDVSLSEPLVPADVRPYIESHQLRKDGTIEFAGRIRVRISPSTGRDPASLKASIIPLYRNGFVQEIAAGRATFRGGTSFGYLDESFQWFEFNQTLSVNQTLESFNIRLNDVVFNNGNTAGYPVNPNIFYQKAQSCSSFDASTNTGNITIVAAFAKSVLSSGEKPKLSIVQKTRNVGNFIPRLREEVITMTRTNSETVDYTYYTASALVGRNGMDTTFDLMIGDSKIEFVPTGDLSGGKVCSPL